MAGFTASYTCDFGYTLEGEDSRICQIDGNWSGSQPDCTLDALFGSVVAVSVILLLVVVSLFICCVIYHRKRHFRLIRYVETFELTDRRRYVVYICPHIL